MSKVILGIGIILVGGATKAEGPRAWGSWRSRPSLPSSLGITGCTTHPSRHPQRQRPPRSRDSCEEGSRHGSRLAGAPPPTALPEPHLKSLRWSQGQSERQNVPLRCHSVCEILLSRLTYTASPHLRPGAVARSGSCGLRESECCTGGGNRRAVEVETHN